jgi:hypothetical protein
MQPVAYSVYADGKFTLNIFHDPHVAQFRAQRLNLEYPWTKYTVVPLYAQPLEQSQEFQERSSFCT